LGLRAARWIIGVSLASLSILLFANPPGSWLAHVPEQERAQANPFEKDPQAILAGGKMFQQHCASCHGKNAEGKGKKPSLHSSRVQNATPGELQWLLRNGSLVAGMPSWSRLPEQQRWQIVTYLKSLKNQEIVPQK
jgi:mono/diheme cytochrome c family protein